MSALQEMKPPSTVESTSSHNGGIRHVVSHETEPELKRPTKTFSLTALAMFVIVMATSIYVLYLLGSIPRQHNTAMLVSAAERLKSALPRVRVSKPRRSASLTVAMLPGDVRAMDEITIYPRTSGYVKKWLADIGDEVKAGQLLAEISTPEVMAQLQQSQAALSESEATLERSRATVNLTTLTTNRIRGLVARNTVSQQDLDDAEGNQAVAIANLRLAEATVEVNKSSVQHMQELQSFSRIVAPFSGTITARNINTGQLVTQGNGVGQSLFQLAQTNPVRVFVNVPQSLAPGVTTNLHADIIAREIPGRLFAGTVTRTTKAIDPLTRTLLTEIHVPNDDHALLTGSYVQVRMEVERPDPPLLIPAAALIFNADGTQVAVVRADQAIELRAVQVIGDIGFDVGIATGISVDDQVVTNPGERMSNGLRVEIDTETEITAANPAKTH